MEKEYDRKAVLESLGDDYLNAVANGQLEEAKKVIDRVAEAGFVREAVDLCRDLLTKKVSI